VEEKEMGERVEAGCSFKRMFWVPHWYIWGEGSLEACAGSGTDKEQYFTIY